MGAALRVRRVQERLRSESRASLITAETSDAASSSEVSPPTVESKAPKRPTELVDGARQSSFAQPAAPGHEFGKLFVTAPQAKLAVSRPGDPLEQEADRIAEQVLGLPEPENLKDEDSQDKAQIEPANGRTSSSVVSRQAVKNTPGTATENPGAAKAEETLLPSAAISGGAPLSGSARSYMEPRFGHDFSQIRVHTDDRASGSAEALNAHAYTIGSDIVFAAGKYSPGTQDGDRLLAHELAHVLQQRGGPPEAGNAERATIDAPATLVTPGEGMIQRQEAGPASAPAPAPAPDTDAQQEQRYNLTLSGDSLSNLTRDQAIAALANHFDWTNNRVDQLSGEHKLLKQNRDDHWLIGSMADLAGGVSMPPLEMWDEPRNQLNAARAALGAKDVQGAANALIQADTAYKSCKDRYIAYKDGTISGAETVKVAAEVTLVACAVVMVAAGGAVIAGAGAAGAAGAGGAAVVGGEATAAAGGAAVVGGEATAAVGTAAAGGATATATAGATATAAGGTTAVAAGGATATAAAGGAAAADAGAATALAQEGAVMLSTGQSSAFLAIITDLSATAAGRATLLLAANVVTAVMQGGGDMTRQEFQTLKQLMELLFQFARGG